MEENTEKLKKIIVKEFNLHAFTLKRDALELCLSVLGNMEKVKRSKWTEKLIDALRKQTLSNSVVDANALRDAIAEVSTAKQENVQLLEVYSAFSTPDWEVTPDGNALTFCPAPLTPAHISVSTHYKRQRLLLVLQRARRLLPPNSLSPIESLMSGAEIENVLILALLVKASASSYFMEDLTANVPIEFTAETAFGDGVFTDGSIMLFDALEAKRRDASIAILSEVHLDISKTLQAVYHLLSGFASCPPVAFVFCGHFCSRPLQADTRSLLQKGFTRLAAQIRELRSSFSHTQFIFVPGPSDPAVPGVLPHPALPSIITSPLSSIPNCVFTTNPARIQYATQEIVVFRADTVERMCRDAVHVPSGEQLPQQVAHTLLSNGHLTPLPDWVQPIVWPADRGLRLHPLPDLLLLPDRFQQYKLEESGCVVGNPSTFGPTSYDFLLYHTMSRELEESRIEL